MALSQPFSDIFRSYYHVHTYLPPVDLGDAALSKHILANTKAAATAQRLISDSEVRSVFSTPLSYDTELVIPRNNTVIQKKGFTLLSSKPRQPPQPNIPFYSVVEHADLPEWVIKAGADRVPEEQFMVGPSNDRGETAFFTKEESLLRIEMADRIRKIAQEAGIEVVVPEKKLVAYADVSEETKPTRKYCVLCQKLDVLSMEETVQAIRDMEQKKQEALADQLATIVQKAGFVDASFYNICLTRKEHKIAFIDTEPCGLMAAKRSGLRNVLADPQGATVEKCARVGLYTLMTTSSRFLTTKQPADVKQATLGLEAFHGRVSERYKAAATPKLSKWKIALSVASLGLIPLIYVIRTIVKLIFITYNGIRIQILTAQMKDELSGYVSVFLFSSRPLPTEQQREIQQKYTKKMAPFLRNLSASTEGIPFHMVSATDRPFL